jgi:hypothetical protein
MFGSRTFALALGVGLSSIGCYSSAPGVVHTSADNPLVIIGAGQIEVGSGAAYYARYIIDRRARVCWFLAGDSVAPLDCCSLLDVAEARPHLAWVNPSVCAARLSLPPPAQPPPPQPAPPAH